MSVTPIISDEFRVNSSTDDGLVRGDTTVATAPDGSFVVAWRQSPPGVDDQLMAQRFDAAGSKVGSEFVIDTDSHDLSVAINYDGTMAFAWANNDGLFIRRYSADGTPIGTLQQYAENRSSGIMLKPSISFGAYGSLVVAWEHQISTSTPYVYDTDEILGAWYDGATDTWSSSPVQIDGGTGSTVRFWTQSATMDELGTSVIAWVRDGSSNDIMFRRYGLGGVPIGSETVVASNGYYSPSIDSMSDGRFMITWVDLSQGTYSIYARPYAADGTPESSEFLVDSFDGHLVNDANVAFKSDGSFVVHWTEWDDTNDAAVSWARTFDENHQPLAKSFRVNETDLTLSNWFEHAAMSVGPADTNVIAYSGNTNGEYDIYARLIQLNSAPQVVGTGNETVMIEVGGPYPTIDLPSRFQDSDSSFGDLLDYTVVSNDDTSLLEAVIIDEQLWLSPLVNADNLVNVVVTAADTIGHSADITFAVDIYASPEVSIAADMTAVVEDNGTATFTVSRDGPALNDLAVNLLLSSSALLGVDYLASGITFNDDLAEITIPAGVSNVNFTLAAQDDQEFESTEQVSVHILDGEAYEVASSGGGLASVDITDDEQAVSISVSTVDAAEDGGTTTFTVTRTGPNDAVLAVDLALQDITEGATLDSDYTFTGANFVDNAGTLEATVTIPVGEDSVDFTLTAQDDTTPENPEEVAIDLVFSSGNYLAISDSESSANTTIIDDEILVDIDVDTNNDGTIDADNTVATGTDDPIESSSAVILPSDGGVKEIKFSVSGSTIDEAEAAGTLSEWSVKLTATAAVGTLPIRIWDTQTKTNELVPNSEVVDTDGNITAIWNLDITTPPASFWVEAIGAHHSAITYELSNATHGDLFDTVLVAPELLDLQDDKFVTRPGTTFGITSEELLTNDINGSSEFLTIDSVGPALVGEIVDDLATNNVLNYTTPTAIQNGTFAYFEGIDEFSYTVSDNFGATETAKVEILIYNDVLATAEPIDDPSNILLDTQILGEIGDGLFGLRDVDMYAATLNAGQAYEIDIQGTHGASPPAVVRVFNSAGEEVMFYDAALAAETFNQSWPVRVRFVPDTTDVYSFGISGAGNEHYGPTEAASGAEAVQFGEYLFRLNTLDANGNPLSPSEFLQVPTSTVDFNSLVTDQSEETEDPFLYRAIVNFLTPDSATGLQVDEVSRAAAPADEPETAATRVSRFEELVDAVSDFDLSAAQNAPHITAFAASSVADQRKWLDLLEAKVRTRIRAEEYARELLGVLSSTPLLNLAVDEFLKNSEEVQLQEVGKLQRLKQYIGLLNDLELTRNQHRSLVDDFVQASVPEQADAIQAAELEKAFRATPEGAAALAAAADTKVLAQQIHDQIVALIGDDGLNHIRRGTVFGLIRDGHAAIYTKSGSGVTKLDGVPDVFSKAPWAVGTSYMPADHAISVRLPDGEDKFRVLVLEPVTRNEDVRIGTKWSHYGPVLKGYRLYDSQPTSVVSSTGEPFGEAGIVQGLFLARDAAAAKRSEIALTFALHVLPFGAAADFWVNDVGNGTDVAISTASDLVLTFTGLGKAAQASVKGVTAAAKLSASVHRLHQANIAVETVGLTHALGRLASVGYSDEEDRAVQAAGSSAEILLRLLGIGFSMKDLPKVREAAIQSRTLLAARKAFLSVDPSIPVRPLSDGPKLYMGVPFPEVQKLFKFASGDKFKADEILAASGSRLRIISDSNAPMIAEGIEGIRIVANGKKADLSVDSIRTLLKHYGDDGIPGDLDSLTRAEIGNLFREQLRRRAGFFGDEGATLKELLEGTTLPIKFRRDTGLSFTGPAKEFRDDVASRDEELTAAFRLKFQKQPGELNAGNIGYADIDLNNGKSGRLRAFSGKQNVTNSSPDGFHDGDFVHFLKGETPEEQLLRKTLLGEEFATDTIDGDPGTHTEPKLLWQVLRLSDPDTTGSVKLYTQKIVCEDCDDVIGRFKTARPGITLEIIFSID